MPRLDPLLQALIERRADALLLVSDQRPEFRFGTDRKPVSAQALSASQIEALLRELAGSIAPDGSFDYALPGGPTFRGACARSGGGLRAELRPVAASAGGPAGATAAADVAAVEAEVATGPRIDPTHIDVLLRRMVELKASDLHLSAGEVPRVRRDGEIEPLPCPSLDGERTRALLEAILPDRNRDEFDRTKDTDFAHEIEGVARFRVNMFADRKGPGAVARVVPNRVLTAEELGLPDPILELCGLSKGLVLVTGPTGSGKSTTLAAMIDHINGSRAEHVITIEDPIEFVHENRRCLINQREVGRHTDGFKRALRAALREDPDIVLLGEMRDLETIEVALETAETGHLVFGTLHTSTACSTVDRIIDQFPADRQAQIRTMLSESLKGVVAQTLLRRKSGGRVAALEILLVTHAIANLIREGKTFQIPSLMQTGKKRGMCPLNDALGDLVRRGEVDPAEAYRKAVDKTGFASMLRAANIRAEGIPIE